jgi:hypothetical protein
MALKKRHYHKQFVITELIYYQNTLMTKYFDITYRKNIRKQLVNYLYERLKKTNFTPEMLAFMIKSHHFTFPLATFFIYLYAPLLLIYIVLFIQFIFIGLFIYLHGCFVTHLEYKLNKKKFINIIDPYLMYFDYPLNNDTRYFGTMCVVAVYFISIVPILYFRHI